MTGVEAKSKVRHEISAVVTRADGTVDDLGVIDSTAWKRFDPRRVAASARIRAANRRNKAKES